MGITKIFVVISMIEVLVNTTNAGAWGMSKDEMEDRITDLERRVEELEEQMDEMG
jgi:predicted transcriptional regulator